MADASATGDFSPDAADVKEAPTLVGDGDEQMVRMEEKRDKMGGRESFGTEVLD